MFVPRHLQPTYPAAQTPEENFSGLKLLASHLLISADLIEKHFAGATHTYVMYYPERHDLLIAPVTNGAFYKVHPNARQQMLKNRNARGDKSISLQEILIDNGIDETDRTLEYEYREKVGFLKIKL
jgi:hypothetical protein